MSGGANPREAIAILMVLTELSIESNSLADAGRFDVTRFAKASANFDALGVLSAFSRACRLDLIKTATLDSSLDSARGSSIWLESETNSISVRKNPLLSISPAKPWTNPGDVPLVVKTR